MSRGAGKWQRAILDACAAAEPLRWVTVDEVGLSVVGRRRSRPTTLSRAEREAIRRAARVLATHGRVELGDGRREEWDSYRRRHTHVIVRMVRFPQCPLPEPVRDDRYLPDISEVWAAAGKSRRIDRQAVRSP